ncbi:type II secretion system F family protein [Dinoroseobacter sp. S124A]|uniref:type II secretion system F family protein n=1 Tax=Dinoroseobacter sp. S124A TaxID=3415128 RepID=UPI003C7D63C1
MFEAVNALLVQYLGPLGPVLSVGFLGAILILVTLPILLRKEQDPLLKLKEERLGKSSADRGDERATALRQDDPGKKLERFSQYLEPQDNAELSAIRLKLIQAGYRQKSSVKIFHFAQFALGLGLLFVGVVYTFLFGGGEEPDVTKAALTTLVPGLCGYYLPKYWVDKRIEKRQEEITNGFPDSLDLMLVCVEAGQGLDQAIIRVAHEIRAGFPALADEFEMVAFEIKAGKDKITVLKDMSERCGVGDVTSFVTVLIQSQSFGTSIADALRVYASEMRDKRVMRAEEKANVLPTKLTLGTMMFTVPPLLIILIGPSMWSIYESLSQRGGP